MGVLGVAVVAGDAISLWVAVLADGFAAAGAALCLAAYRLAFNICIPQRGGGASNPPPLTPPPPINNARLLGGWIGRMVQSSRTITIPRQYGMRLPRAGGNCGNLWAKRRHALLLAPSPHTRPCLYHSESRPTLSDIMSDPFFTKNEIPKCAPYTLFPAGPQRQIAQERQMREKEAACSKGKGVGLGLGNREPLKPITNLVPDLRQV